MYINVARKLLTFEYLPRAGHYIKYFRFYLIPFNPHKNIKNLNMIIPLLQIL